MFSKIKNWFNIYSIIYLKLVEYLFHNIFLIFLFTETKTELEPSHSRLADNKTP